MRLFCCGRRTPHVGQRQRRLWRLMVSALCETAAAAMHHVESAQHHAGLGQRLPQLMRLSRDQLLRPFLGDDDASRDRVVVRGRQMDLHAAQLRWLQAQMKIRSTRLVDDSRLSDECAAELFGNRHVRRCMIRCRCSCVPCKRTGRSIRRHKRQHGQRRGRFVSGTVVSRSQTLFGDTVCEAWFRVCFTSVRRQRRNRVVRRRIPKQSSGTRGKQKGGTRASHLTLL